MEGATVGGAAVKACHKKERGPGGPLYAVLTNGRLLVGRPAGAAGVRAGRRAGAAARAESRGRGGADGDDGVAAAATYARLLHAVEIHDALPILGHRLQLAH